MPQPSGRRRVGLGLAGLLSLASIPSVLVPTPAGEVGPPYAVLLLSSVAGMIGIVAVVLAWRGSPAALRVAAGAVIIPTLTALPAFFVDVPLSVRLVVALAALLAVASSAMMLSTSRPPARVMD